MFGIYHEDLEHLSKSDRYQNHNDKIKIQEEENYDSFNRIVVNISGPTGFN